MCPILFNIYEKKKKRIFFIRFFLRNSISFYLFVLTFAMKFKEANYKSFKYFIIFWPMKNDVNLNTFHRKMSDCVSFSLFGFTVVIRLRNFDFESHWNIWIFFDKKDMVSNLNIFYGKMSDFVSFPLFGFTLVIKVRNFDVKVQIMFYQTVSHLVQASLFE